MQAHKSAEAPLKEGRLFFIKISGKLPTGTTINNQDPSHTDAPENNKSKNTGKFVQGILSKIGRLIGKRGRSRNSSNIEESTRYIKISPSGLEYYSKIRYSRSRPRRRMPRSPRGNDQEYDSLAIG
jgi:hypothetical protein